MGISPRDFWAMSLPEWRAAVDGFALKKVSRRNAPLSRDELQTMMHNYPDG